MGEKAEGVVGTQWGADLIQVSRAANYRTQVGRLLLETVFWEHGQAHSLVRCPRRLGHYRARLDQLQQSLEHLLPGPPLEKFTDPCPTGRGLGRALKD